VYFIRAIVQAQILKTVQSQSWVIVRQAGKQKVSEKGFCFQETHFLDPMVF
jgi:hypothetical protein